MTTSHALGAGLRALEDGRDVVAALHRAGRRTSQANGALMRVSPLGIFGHRLDSQKISAMARFDASLTHPHPVCQDANAIFTLTLARAILTGLDGPSLARFARHHAESNNFHPDIIATLNAAAIEPPADFLTHSGWVRVALHNAFFHLEHTPDVERALITTIGAGGDTDTNAAIAGALLGAVHGRDAIPFAWQDRVLTCRPLQRPGVKHPRPRAFWPVDALQVAEALVKINP